ncbi:MAG: YeeE/YedE family protein [Rhodospirillaceae bacterium]|nr:YeeE/YedE family protein [Rhodospirillaceae bacterium]
MRVFIALITGLVFGAGLTVAQMIDPAKVLAFLDFGGIATGTWDPSLALVMAGALCVTTPAYFVARKLGRPVLRGTLRLPTRRDIDPRLVVGAAIFGIGWGAVGFCPGPAVAVLGFGASKALVFFAALLGGMAVYELTLGRQLAFSAEADRCA